MRTNSIKLGWLYTLIILLGLTFHGTAVYAQGTTTISPAATTGTGAPAKDTCTTDPSYDISNDGYGIISGVTKQITGILSTAQRTLFQAVAGSGAFQSAVSSALVLSVVIYGIMIVTGLVQLNLQDGIIRVIKIGIITSLTTGAGWGFFSDNVVSFFNDGTDQIIAQMSQISAGAGKFKVNPNEPLAVLDGAFNHVFAVQMFISTMAMFLTGPYGVLFGTILLYGVYTFLRAMLSAVKIYLLSFIAKALLFGLGPIFISFLLFQRTRHLFDGWLNQVINFSLQPILLFSFLGFYSTLITQSLKQILSVDLCWGPLQRVGPFEINFWRFMVNGQPFTGSWTAKGAEIRDATGAIATKITFPIDIVDVMIFLLLAELAWRYTEIAVTIANELASSSSRLSIGAGPLEGWFADQKARFAEAGKGALRGANLGNGQRGAAGGVGLMQGYQGLVSNRKDVG